MEIWTVGRTARATEMEPGFQQVLNGFLVFGFNADLDNYLS